MAVRVVNPPPTLPTINPQRDQPHHRPSVHTDLEALILHAPIAPLGQLRSARLDDQLVQVHHDHLRDGLVLEQLPSRRQLAAATDERTLSRWRGPAAKPPPYREHRDLREHHS